MSAPARMRILGRASLLPGPARPLGSEPEVAGEPSGTPGAAPTAAPGPLVRTLTDQLDERPRGMTRWPRLDRFGKALARACDLATCRDELTGGPPTGLYVSSHWSCMETNASFDRGLITKGPRLASPLVFPYTLPGSCASEVAMALGLLGPYVVMPGGPATALACLLSATDTLADGGAARLLVASADVLGAHTLRHVQQWPRLPREPEPPLAEAAAALWLAAEAQPPAGPGRPLGVEGALGGEPGSPGDAARVMQEALERAEVPAAALRCVVSATAEQEMLRLEIAAADRMAPRACSLRLVFKLGSCGAALGLLAVAAALEGPAEVSEDALPALVMAAEPGSFAAVVLTP